VLLAGINDSVHIQRQLVHELVMMRVRPYYLYQCDLVEGAGHFRTTVSKGIEIIEGLRGHTSGFAVPEFIVDAPGGGGKVPISPTYLLAQSPGRVVIRNFEGYITTYAEPLDYDPTAVRHLEAEVGRRFEPGQEGLSALLEGHSFNIKPEGFDEIHRRGRQGEHRLSANTQKWQPYGLEHEAPPESAADEEVSEQVSEEEASEPVRESEAAVG
jgi:lysine 2,3-aminomutase